MGRGLDHKAELVVKLNSLSGIPTKHGKVIGLHDKVIGLIASSQA